MGIIVQRTMAKTLHLGLGLWVLLFPRVLWAWSELGHHVVARIAARVVSHHPLLIQQEKQSTTDKRTAAIAEFKRILSSRWIQQGHLSNIPDTYWRNLDGGLKEFGKLLGDGTHYFNADRVATPKEKLPVKVPLTYEKAKLFAKQKDPKINFYNDVGTLPWRGQQLASLYQWSAQKYPKKKCKSMELMRTHPTQVLLGYAGLLAHMTGDASAPYHVTRDYDGVGTGQKGLHTYFETSLVNALEWGLDEKVFKKALLLYGKKSKFAKSLPELHLRARQLYPKMNDTNRVTALLFALIEDSLSYVAMVREKDERYAIATFKEARENPRCRRSIAVRNLETQFKAAQTQEHKGRLLATKVKALVSRFKSKNNIPCRRAPMMVVEGQSIAQHFEELIIDRLALATVVTADIWVGTWLEANMPPLCWTWNYALKPAFISPTDAKCFGYALAENPKELHLPAEKSPLNWPNRALSTKGCLVFR